MASFYYRCDTEGAANPLRSRCKYCEWVRLSVEMVCIIYLHYFCTAVLFQVEGEIKRCKK